MGATVFERELECGGVIAGQDLRNAHIILESGGCRAILRDVRLNKRRAVTRIWYTVFARFVGFVEDKI